MAEMKSKLQDFYKRLDSRKSTYFLVYSVIFIILAIGVFSFYFFTGKTFIWEVDGWEQHYKSLIYYSQYLRDFFKNIFINKTNMTEKKEKALQTEQVSSNIRFDHNLREKIEQENNRKVLAEKLLYGQIGISELNETEVNEMKEYFTNDIQSIDNELSKIKQHIIAMQQELKQ